MRSKWAGVAIAAMMACGWAGGAKAASLSFLTQDILVVSFGGSNFDTSDISTGFVVGTFINGPATLKLLGEDINEGFDLRITSTRETYDPSKGFGTAPLYAEYKVGSGFASPQLIITDPYEGKVFDYGVSIKAVTFSPVPLPASAALFGAALLALGGIGYASRQREARAA